MSLINKYLRYLMVIILASSVFSGLKSAYSETGDVVINQVDYPSGDNCFEPGDDVDISGTVTGVTDGNVELTVTDADGETVRGADGKQLEISDQGFEYTLELPDDGLPDGVYEIAITYEGFEGDAFFNVCVAPDIIIAVETDNESYEQGDQVRISGTVEGSRNGDTVEITITDPDLDKIIDGQEVTINSDDFSYTFTLDSDAVEGTYDVNVDFKGVGEFTEFTSFEVTEGSGNDDDNDDNDDNGNDDISITLDTDAEDYQPGDRVKISGKVNNSNDGDKVEITVFDPDSKVLEDVDQTNVSIRDEAFSLSFDLADDADEGSYKVEAEFEDTKVSATFKVASDDTGTDNSISDLLLKKVGTIHVETDGDEYSSGDQVLISGTVKGAHDEDKVEVTVFGPNGKPVDNVDKRSRMILDEKFSFSFTLADDAASGRYKVLVTADGDEEDTVFTVEGGSGDNDPFTVKTDKEAYDAGDRVEISGTVEDADNGDEVEITVYGPDDEKLDEADEETDTIRDQEFSFSFTLADDAASGRYKVLVTADGDEEDTVFTVEGGSGSSGSGQFTVETDGETFSPGQSLQIMGTVEDADNGDEVEITVYGPDDEKLLDEEQVVVNSDSFLTTLSLPSEAPSGRYAVKVTFESREALAFFTIEGEDDKQEDTSTSILTDETSYNQGQSVTISGTIAGASDGDEVNLNVILPTGSTLLDVKDKVVTITDEIFSTTFTLKPNAKLGAYEVDAEYGDEFGNLIFTYFVVVKSGAIVTVTTEDDTYVPDSTVEISGTAVGASDGALVEVNIIDPDGNAPISEEFAEVASQNFVYSYHLPDDAKAGRYLVSVRYPLSSEDLVSGIFTVEVPENNDVILSIDTDKTIYEADDQVEVSGDAREADDGDSLKISVFDPDGSVLSDVDEELVTINDESFAFDFNLGESPTPGLYKVKAEIEGVEIFTYFGIQEEQISNVEGTFAIETDDLRYNPGDQVEISGTVEGADDGDSVKITVTDPDDDTLSKVNGKIVTIENEQFDLSFELLESTDEGVYKIKAEFDNDDIFSYFDVIGKDFNIEIDTDEIEYEAGDQVEISGTVEGADDGDSVKITVTDPKGDKLDEVDQVTDRIVDEEFSIQFGLEDKATIGVYTIQVSYGTHTKFSYFDVLGDRIADPLEVITDDTTYAPGDRVQINGIALASNSGDRVDLTVYDPYGDPLEIVFHKQIRVEDLQFAYSFELSNTAPQGLYEVYVIFGKDFGYTKFQVNDALTDNSHSIVEDSSGLIRISDKTLILGSTVVDLQSSSTITGVKLDEEAKSLSFNVTGDAGVPGILTIDIGKILKGPYIVLIDSISSDNVKMIGDPESPDAKLQITYSHSSHDIEIMGTQVVPEFPAYAIVATVAATMVIVIMLGRSNYFGRSPQL